MNRLEGKVAVITGGSSGIGAAVAKLFHKEGAQVVIFGRTEDEITQIEKELGSDALAVVGDVSKLVDLEHLFKSAHEKFGKIDIVFANAGMNNPLQTVVDMPEDGFDKTFSVNAKGVYFTVQKAIPYLNSPASIVLTSSVGNVKGWPGDTVYAGTKAAIRAFARGMSAELLDRKIRVNVLTPGPTETAVLSPKDVDAEKLEQMKKGVIESIPLKRIAEPDEIAHAVLFLASDESSFMLGSELVLDGGLTQL